MIDAAALRAAAQAVAAISYGAKLSSLTLDGIDAPIFFPRGTPEDGAGRPRLLVWI